MKRFGIVILLLIGVLGLFGQPWEEKIITDPILRTDYLIEYTWDLEISDWVVKNSIKYNYTYENGEIHEVTTQDYNTGVFSNKIIYFYTPEKILRESIYQRWESDIWISYRRDLWFQDENGLNNETIIQFYLNGEWTNIIRYTDYQYDNRRLKQYTYQLWSGGKWIDSIYDSWYYDENGNLILRLQNWVNDIPSNKVIYIVGENNHRESLTIYNWINGKWVENTHWLYEYNQCGRTSAIVYQVFKNGDWINSTRQEYFYSLHIENILPGQRVPVCHNGQTIYVSVNAVDAHLAHGDCLGNCLNERDNPSKKNENSEVQNLKPPFIVYPNPAREMITVKFDQDLNNEMKRIELTDFYGKLVKTFIVRENSDVTIYRGNLMSGKYYVRLIGKEVFSQVVIFE
ncbi:MAG: hypothetical protein A2Y71_03720 [Bacteroidetes bacterium RBG_13_42_15]|jgi:hypothetical protein|nr:MAG: hypothetical protein A2Y71_03720 [Bacteroidetes bacterium RBG_13_42_15]